MSLSLESGFLSSLKTGDSSTKQSMSAIWRLKVPPLQQTGYLLPNDHVLRRHVFRLPHDHLAIHLGGIERCRDFEHDPVRVQFVVEIGAQVDGVFNLGFADLVHDRMQSEREIDVGR